MIARRWQCSDLAGKVDDHRIWGELGVQSLDLANVHEDASSRCLDYSLPDTARCQG
ncbi:hypothetical protein [Paraburkholderia tuberum]|uniref:hypothetical protein n=1 Tax=Paraburkholderia TaxID=1822464 RepID=UPI001428A6B5|nr:hypothetical protein [Paraburkholderia tuberum]